MNKAIMGLFVAAFVRCGSAAANPLTPTASAVAPIQSIVWKGHAWKVTNGGMAGISPGSGNNVFIDAKGYLHLKIAHIGTAWTASELYTVDKMGFGTYQWQIEGAVDAMDPSTVLGLFPYGPAAGIGIDGENELDIEFSKWNNTVPTNADFTYYPPTGHGTKDSGGNSVASDTDNFSLSLSGEMLVTARTVWRSASVVSTVMLGLQPLGTSAHVLHTRTYAPANPTMHIPQVALPLGINFWSFQKSPVKDQEIVIRNFQYSPN